MQAFFDFIIQLFDKIQNLVFSIIDKANANA